MATKILNGADLQGQKVVNSAAGTNPNDLVTYQQLLNALAGLDWHPHVRVMTSSNTTISGPGATIDGVTMAAGDRVLLTGQTTGSQNGAWIWNGSASAMTRPTDYPAATALVKPSATFFVTEGTANHDTAWTLTTDGTVTVDTTSTSWAQVGGGGTYTAGNGLQLSSNQFSVLAADSTIVVSGSGIKVGSSVGTVKKYAATITTAANTPLTVNHALGTQDITVALYDAATGGNLVIADITQTDANNLTVTTAAACTNYRIVVTG